MDCICQWSASRTRRARRPFGRLARCHVLTTSNLVVARTDTTRMQRAASDYTPMSSLIRSSSAVCASSVSPAQSGVQLPFVSALLVLDSEGSRVAVKYWDESILTASKGNDELKVQMAFEKKVFGKTVRPQRQEGLDAIRQTAHTTRRHDARATRVSNARGHSQRADRWLPPCV
jgi:hypothetical protein